MFMFPTPTVSTGDTLGSDATLALTPFSTVQAEDAEIKDRKEKSSSRFQSAVGCSA